MQYIISEFGYPCDANQTMCLKNKECDNPECLKNKECDNPECLKNKGLKSNYLGAPTPAITTLGRASYINSRGF